jgi:hypothetical protein
MTDTYWAWSGGGQWRGSVYVDKCLPFGLRSAPLLFSAVADALQRMMQGKGASHVDHYVDDVITMGRPGTVECANNVRIMLQVCKEAGAPVEEDKTEGRPNHHIRLNLEARSDIEWWYRFASSWNGVSMFLELRRAHLDVQLTSDASGKWGCGAIYDRHWFQLQYSRSQYSKCTSPSRS